MEQVRTGEGKSLRERFKLYSVKEILEFPSPQWRVEPLLPAGAFTMLYAPKEQGKTFFALDLGLSIASGQDFHGRRVKQGPVIYVWGEARGGLKNRIAAWLKEHGLENVPEAFFVLDAVQFRRKGDVAALRAQIDGLKVNPAIVIIDTFARCAVGVKENDATEVGEWIDAIRALQEQWNADVLALHHSTKPQGNEDPGERGSSAFIDAVDTAIRLKRTGTTVVVSCKKQKDAEHFKTFNLTMKVVALGVNDEGEAMSSLVLVSGQSGESSFGLSDGNLAFLTALAEFPNRTAQRGELVKKLVLPERTFDRRRQDLQDGKFIEPADQRGGYRLTELGVLAIAKALPATGHGKAA